MLSPQKQLKILIFLPEAAGKAIVSRLAKCGFQSVSVSTVPEAFDALRSGEFAFAITTRPDIDLLRNIRAIPVINIEVFFHTAMSSDGNGPVKSKRFDSKAFLERVEFLVLASPPAGPDVGIARANTPLGMEKSNIRWWSIAVKALRNRYNRKDIINVHP